MLKLCWHLSFSSIHTAVHSKSFFLYLLPSVGISVVGSGRGFDKQMASTTSLGTGDLEAGRKRKTEDGVGRIENVFLKKGVLLFFHLYIFFSSR